MKTMLKSLLIIVAVATIAGGATYAYFSDTAISTGNTFSAGTLDLKINDLDGVTKSFSLTNLKPGAWDNSGGIVLKNAGTVDGHAWLEITNVVNGGANTGKLADFVKASFQQNAAPWTRFGGANPISTEAGSKIDLFDLNAGASMPMVLYAVWPSTYTDAQDNTVQGNNVTFDVVFHLEQKL